MDGERKKRKTEKDEEQEDDEEKSVEKFFALIRSTREARDRLLGHGDASKQQEKKQGEEEGKEKAMGAWTPTFRLEDFMGGSQAKGAKDFPGIQAGPSEKKRKRKTEGRERLFGWFFLRSEHLTMKRSL